MDLELMEKIMKFSDEFDKLNIKTKNVECKKVGDQITIIIETLYYSSNKFKELEKYYKNLTVFVANDYNVRIVFIFN